MATHQFGPGDPVTFTASTDVTEGRLVAVTGDRMVGPASVDTKSFVGTAAFNASPGEKVTVLVGGVQRIETAGVVAAGSLVAAAAAGTIVAAVAPAVGQVVGLALTAGGPGVTVQVQMS